MNDASEGVYAYLTDDVVGEFSGAGGETLIQFLQAPDQTQEEAEETSSLIYTEILLIYQEGRITLDEILQFLGLAIMDETHAVVFCEVLDVFPITELIQQLLLEIYKKQSIIKYSTLARFIDSESLSKSYIVPADVLNRQLNTRKRDDFYTQKKFNLLHEELEGFSKLVIEIYSILCGDETSYQVDYALDIIESLIGHYNLDPNRVLDILMDTFSNNFVGNHDFIIALLKKSRWWPSVESDCATSIESLGIGGNESAAKCIGLKLLKCPVDRDLPETFKIMVACLMKEGFVSFASIWRYVRPDDKDMKALESLYQKELDQQVFKASASALALAAPLLDDEDTDTDNNKSTSSNKDTRKQESLTDKLQSNFKYQFLKVFIGNGLYWPTIYVLAEYPFLAFVQPEIHELICRAAHSMIEPLYSSITTFSKADFTQFQTGRKVTFAKPLNTVKLEDFPCTEYLSFKPTIRSFSQKKFSYFYSRWSERLPVVRDPKDLFQMSREFLKFLGVNLSQDLELFSKLCEIGAWDLQSNPTDAKKQEWFNYFRNFILPAIPCIHENSFAVDKAFKILGFYTPEERYNLYSELYQVHSKNNPYIKMAFGKAERATKDVLKRLSKENVRPMMRRLAKISFSNPLPCFLTILQQIESYDNLNSLVVETARYFNSYGWDVLTLAILLRLTASGRSNIQNDGLNERQWIQSLASFIGKICQRYPKSIDLTIILKFLLKSFHNKEVSNVIVLKEILISMGGIQTITNLTLYQVNMINCGSCLEKIVYRTIDDVRFERFKSGGILTETLDNMNAVNELLILLCGLGNMVVYDSEDSNLKVLANKTDDLNSLLHLFTQLVGFFSQTNGLSKPLLPISELVSQYGVPIEWAYEIWRPFLSTAITESTANESGNLVLEELRSQCPKLLPETTWETLTVDLFTSFWQLSLYDINYSDEFYDAELEKLESSKKGLRETLSLSKKDRDISQATLDKYRKELQQNEVFIKTIPHDKDTHKKHHELVMERLTAESKIWFTNADLVHQQTKSFLQHCVLPRAIHSSFDAAFTAKFLFKLHELKTVNFSIINALDELINSKILFGTLFTLTPTEAENLGLFFADLLKSLKAWSIPSAFGEVNELVSYSETCESLSFDEYRLRLYGYHSTILADVGQALSVNEYMSRRNAITLMKNLLGVYPNVEDHCEEVVELIQNIALNESREDLKLSSSALMGHIKSRTKDWIHLWDFIPLSEEEREEHMKKRREIHEAHEKAKQKAAEDLKQKELLAKQEEENSRQKKLAAVISYEDSGTSSKRPESRGGEVSKGRYDYYSKYGQVKDDKLKSDVKSRDLSQPKTNEGAQKETPSKEENDKEGEAGRKSRASDLKARLLEAKKEYKENRSRDFTPQPNLPSPVEKREADKKKDPSPRGVNLPAFPQKSDVPKSTTPRPRAPLPPQPSTNGHGTTSHSQRKPMERSTYNEQNNRFNNRTANNSANRLPSNSRMPQNSSASARASSTASTIAKTPVNSRVPPTAPPSARVQSNPSFNSRVQPAGSANARSQASTSANTGNQPSAPANSRTTSATPLNPRTHPPAPPSARAQSAAPPNARSNGRSSLPPPPPPPPISLKQSQSQYRSQSQSRNDGHADGYNRRGSNRYDGKRKHENYEGGRGYDKKSRY